VFLEAWASGLPIVGHDSDRLRWILSDRHFLCDTTHASDLHAALRAALSAGRSGTPAGVERYSWESIGSQYRDFMSETLAGINCSAAENTR
jgi:glycosyltransferase involved in cell wall biosynthesis